MISLATFVRRTPTEMVAAHFAQAGLFGNVTNGKSARDCAKHAVEVADAADEQTRTKITQRVERITAMADRAGQTALYGVTKHQAILDRLENGCARSSWVFLNEPEAFRQAEEIRYTDEHRRGRKWDGFLGTPNLQISRGPDVLARFKADIRANLKSENVHIEVFERRRNSFDDQVFHLTQATIYRDGRPDDFWEFVNGKLGRRTRKPVYEAAVTYEPESGVIEVVANDRTSRENLVRLFTRNLLGCDTEQNRLPFRQFDLDILLQPFDFPTDVQDGIESVRVTELRLMPFDTAGERVTLVCARQSPHTIWEMAERHFADRNPLIEGWLATQAKLSIAFHPREGGRRRVLPLTVTMPHGCDLKDRTEEERIIGEKYLRRWQLVKDV